MDRIVANQTSTIGLICLTERNLAAADTANAFLAGASYWRSGHVRQFALEPPDRVRGKVRGSGRSVYSQTIKLVERAGGVAITGE